MKRDAFATLQSEVNTAWHAEQARLKAAHEKRLEERSEELADELHGCDVPHVPLDCGCEWRCDGWERGRGDSYATARRYPINPRYTRECEAHE